MKKILCSLIIFLLSAFSALCQASGDITLNVQFSAGPLQHSLPEISRRYGVSIVARSELLQTLSHGNIRGDYSLTQLLTEILQNTGLRYREVSQGYLIEAIPEGDAAPDNVEQLLVLGQRFNPASPYAQGSLYAALNYRLAEEQARPESVSVLSAAGLQALPYENLAESLQYLPGVMLNSERGEGLSLSVRGLGPQYQRILLNGHVMAINENVRNSGQGGRQFRFDVLPAENVAQVEVLKSASGPGAIGSDISITGYRPLSVSELPHYFRTEWEYQPLAERSYPTISAMTGWRNHDETVGILFGLQYRERYHYQDQYQTWNWDLNKNAWNNSQLDDDLLVPSNRFALTNEQEQRRRRSFSTSGQWRLENQNIISFDYFLSDLSIDFNEERLQARLDAEDAVFSDPGFSGNALVGGFARNVYLQSSLDTSRQLHRNQLWMTDYEWQHGAWEGSVSLAVSSAHSGTDKPISRTVINSVPTDLNFSAPADKRILRFLPGFDPLQAENFVALDLLTRRDIQLQHNVQSLQLDWRKNLTVAGLSSWKSGFSQVQQQRRYRRQDVALSHTEQVLLVPSLDMSRNQAQPFLSAVNHQSVKHWLVPNSRLQQRFDSALTFPVATEADRKNSYDSGENLLQWYNQIDFEIGEHLTGNAAIRHSRLTLSSSGYEAGSASAVSYQRNYHYWLPSLNILYQAGPFWQWRAHLSHSVSMPNYQDLTPGVSLNSTEGVFLASAGNPRLKPMPVDQAELSVSFRPEEGVRYQYSFFAKNLQDYIVSESQPQLINGDNYRVTLPVNNGKASILGHEVSYDIGFPDWGIQTTATVVHSDVAHGDEHYPMVQVSPVSLAGQFYWQLGNTRMQWGVSYRSDYLLEKGAEGVADVYVEGDMRLQAQLSWILNRETTLSLTGTNLLGSEDISYIRSSGKKIYHSLEYSAPRFLLVLNVNF